jgi:hypothetical protein
MSSIRIELHIPFNKTLGLSIAKSTEKQICVQNSDYCSIGALNESLDTATSLPDLKRGAVTDVPVGATLIKGL